MKVYCCQLDIVWENKPANQAKVKSLLAGADIAADSLVVLPEMFSTGFSMNVETIHERSPSETETFLSNLAREFRAYFIAGLVSRAPDGRGRNEAVVFRPDGKEIARYCKIHPFTFGGESKHYAAGTDIVTFAWNGCQVAPFVCYDLRFPEIFRVAVQKGAQMFVIIANWPAKRLHHWLTLLQARAIENQAFVIGVNRTGYDPKLHYPGRTIVVNPKGEIIADGNESEGVVRAEIDPAGVSAWRAEFPALQDIHREYISIPTAAPLPGL
jgi:omega-amidase